MTRFIHPDLIDEIDSLRVVVIVAFGVFEDRKDDFALVGLQVDVIALEEGSPLGITVLILLRVHSYHLHVLLFVSREHADDIPDSLEVNGFIFAL